MSVAAKPATPLYDTPSTTPYSSIAFAGVREAGAGNRNDYCTREGMFAAAPVTAVLQMQAIDQRAAIGLASSDAAQRYPPKTQEQVVSNQEEERLAG